MVSTRSKKNVQNPKILNPVEQKKENSLEPKSQNVNRKFVESKDFKPNLIIEQITKSVPRKARTLFNHYAIEIPYHMIQLDVLYLPHDKYKNKLYKYALTAIDVASRFKWAQPLTTKYAKDALEAFKKMNIPLEKVKIINTDGGGEFLKEFKSFIVSKNIEFKVNRPSDHLAFVESFNKHLSNKLFEHEFKKELETQSPNKEWVGILQETVNEMNSQKTRLIKMEPKYAIEQERVIQPKNKFSSKDLLKKRNIGDIVRRVLNKDEILDVATNTIQIENRRRATDPNWSIDTFKIIQIGSLCPECLYYHKIENVETGEVFPHTFTYWQLQEV